MNGKSYSKENMAGSRRKAVDFMGKMQTLAPRSMRAKGKHYMSECTEQDIAESVFGISSSEWFNATGEIEIKTKGIERWEAIRKQFETEGVEIGISKPVIGSWAIERVSKIKQFMSA